MALRNQPYFPLYVQDFMTDEKLNECSAKANGIYIRLMCIMHKSEEYGTILLKQKYKQNESKSENLLEQKSKQVSEFASQLSKNMPFSVQEIAEGLTELLEEKVVHIEGDKLIQKRMQKDGIISDKRSSAGSKGGKKSSERKQNFHFAADFAQAKPEAKTKQNTENEIEIESEVEIENISSNISGENFSKVYDPYDYAANEKYFKIYQDECPQLVKLGFERRDNKTVQAIAEFRTVTNDNLEYFKAVCQKANKLIVIASNKIDFRSILNNHIGIYGDKYNSNDTKAGGSGYDY